MLVQLLLLTALSVLIHLQKTETANAPCVHFGLTTKQLLLTIQLFLVGSNLAASLLKPNFWNSVNNYGKT